MPEPTPTRALALVTGASSGLGRDFCVRLALAGCALAMVARDRAAMEALAEELDQRYGTPVLILPTDLAEPGAASAVAGAIADRGLEIELLINNAGFGKLGPFHTLPPSDITGMVMVNVLAATELAHAVLPGMIARGRGRILNVASVAAFLPGPMMAVYYASKAYLLSLSEALWEETRGTGVTVTALCPGPTESDFFRRAGATSLGKLPMARSETVVRLAYDAMMRGDRLVIPGAANRLAAFMTRFAPKSIVLRQVRRIQSAR
jgi:short-subunit dehydrogenase